VCRAVFWGTIQTMRDTVVVVTVGGVLLLAVAGEALPLALSKAGDLRAVVCVDSAPRVEAARPLPNPFLSTG
jgi:hypothetical protein